MLRKVIRGIIYGLVSLTAVTIGVLIAKHNQCPNCKSIGVSWLAKNYYACPKCKRSFEKKTKFFNLFRKG